MAVKKLSYHCYLLNYLQQTFKLNGFHVCNNMAFVLLMSFNRFLFCNETAITFEDKKKLTSPKNAI